MPWPVAPIEPPESTPVGALNLNSPPASSLRSATTTADPSRDAQIAGQDNLRWARYTIRLKQYEDKTKKKGLLCEWMNKHIDKNVFLQIFEDEVVSDPAIWIDKTQVYVDANAKAAENRAFKEYIQALKPPRSLQHVEDWCNEWLLKRKVAESFGFGEASSSKSWIKALDNVFSELLPLTMEKLLLRSSDFPPITPQAATAMLIADVSRKTGKKQSSHVRSFVGFQGEEDDEISDFPPDTSGRSSPPPERTDSKKRKRSTTSSDENQQAKRPRQAKEGDFCLICCGPHLVKHCFGVTSNRLPRGGLVPQAKLSFIARRCKEDKEIQKAVEEARKNSS